MWDATEVRTWSALVHSQLSLARVGVSRGQGLPQASVGLSPELGRIQGIGLFLTVGCASGRRSAPNVLFVVV